MTFLACRAALSYVRSGRLASAAAAPMASSSRLGINSLPTPSSSSQAGAFASAMFTRAKSFLAPREGQEEGSARSGAPSSSFNVAKQPASRRRAGRGLPNKKRFLPGQYYAPRQLNLEKMYERTPRRAPPLLGPSAAEAKRNDVLYKLNLKPGHPTLHDDSYKNPVLLSNYVTEMGKIQKRSQTGLTRRSQREIGKAVRRARAMGLMPVMRRDYKAWTK